MSRGTTIVPPPTPNRPLNAPARLPITATRRSLADMGGHTKVVTAPTAEMLAEALKPGADRPERSAGLCDIDGTPAPTAERADQARAPPSATRLPPDLAAR